MTPSKYSQDLVSSFRDCIHSAHIKYNLENEPYPLPMKVIKQMAVRVSKRHIDRVIDLLEGWPEPRDITIQKELDFSKNVLKELETY